VAKEGKSYAEAIRSVVRQHDPKGIDRNAVNSQQHVVRADVIDAPASKKRVVLDTPTQAMKPWLRKPTMKPAEVQTDEIQKEVAVQTSRDAECQTDFEPPVEKFQQTSADIAVQTIEAIEQAVQTTTDVQLQTVPVVAELSPDDKYTVVTIWQIMKMLMHYSDAEDSSPA